MDLHLQVDPLVSVSEGHEIGCWVAAAIRAKFNEVSDITFHIDPEDDADVDQDGPFFETLSELGNAGIVCVRRLGENC